MRFALALVLAVGLAGPAAAHKPSDAYLTLRRDGTTVVGQWDIALRDLDTAIGLDRNGDGEITWGELRGRHAAIETYAIARLALSSAGERCPLRVTGHQVDSHTDGAYAVIHVGADCPHAGPTLAVHYAALFDVDPQHRGLLNFVEAGVSRSVIFSVEAPRQTLGGSAHGPLRQFVAYVAEGMWHIGIGLDHVLFLVSLLLPAVLVRSDGAWQATTGFRAAFWDVFRTVTAFTAAHTITLTLAALEAVTLPSRLVESAIAASVVLAALNNVVPIVDRRRWLVAFGFGLVHGFGFASVLRDLGLPTDSLALSLAGFNLGVELGQLAIVAVFLPAAFLVRRTPAYRRVLVTGGSVAIATLAALWLVERAFDLPVLSRLAAA
jgi:hypothetical protein